jgi:hypothetical protein
MEPLELAQSSIPLDCRFVEHAEAGVAKKSPYAILGITPDATEGEAKRNFRILAKQYHPDRNPGDKEAEAKFKQVYEAWDAVKDILPKSAVPFPDIDPDDPGFEDAIVQWMIAMDAAAPKRAFKEKPPAKQAAAQEDVWTTVASDAAANTGMAVHAATGPVDWRHQTIRRWKPSLGLEKINAEEAEQLIKGRPNAFAALKIVQQAQPDLCLYDAILERADRSSSTALTIVGAEAVDRSACAAALRNPFASVDMAAQNIETIAPHVKLDGKPINPRKLAFDVAFLREAIEELAARIASRHGGTSA